MTSKVTAKLPLGVAFSMLLISLALFVGCKQDVAPRTATHLQDTVLQQAILPTLLGKVATTPLSLVPKEA